VAPTTAAITWDYTKAGGDGGIGETGPSGNQAAGGVGGFVAILY
jgi:hypothetical protein